MRFSRVAHSYGSRKSSSHAVPFSRCSSSLYRLLTSGYRLPRAKPALSITLAILMAVAAPPVAGGPGQLPANPASLPPPRPAVLVFTTARLGEMSSDRVDRGGLSRQSTYLAGVARRAEVGFLEAGDTFFGDYRIPPSSAPLLVARARLLSEVLGEQGLLATSVGDCDLAVGLGVLRSLADKATFSTLCANLATTDGQHPFPPTLERTVGALRVGIVGLLSQKVGVSAVHSQLVVEPPAAALAKALQGFSPRPDRIVVLAHMPVHEAEALADAVAGVDLMILGHSGGRLGRPRMAGSTLIVGSDSRGRELGEVNLTTLPQARERAAKLTVLGVSIRDDLKTITKLRAFDRSHPWR